MCITESKVTISELAEQFSHLEHTTVYNIVTKNLGYHQLGPRWVLKMLITQNEEQSMSNGRFETDKTLKNALHSILRRRAYMQKSFREAGAAPWKILCGEVMK